MRNLKVALNCFSFFTLLFATMSVTAQSKKPNYNPCLLKDSVADKLAFIKLNAARIFKDTFECKDLLLDSMAAKYVQGKDLKYLDALTAIHQNPLAKTDGLYTDVVRLFMDDDFIGFINQLYRSKAKLLPLQNELIAAMNMILNGRPLKQKYMGQLNIEIARVKDSHDTAMQTYLEKLKQKIDEEQYH